MGRQVGEVVKRAAKWDAIEWILLADRPNLPFHHLEGDTSERNVFRRRGDRFRRWEQLSLPHTATGWRADVLHCPANALPLWQPLSTVVTLHDTLTWNSPEEGPPDGWYLGLILPAEYRKCRAITLIARARDAIS